ncbi:MAG: hypothetical protein GVY13_03385 [Alphaproteobacteria bacterium]|nr:hypothetical protein [Alphaproteobacteria bacterium]
MAMSFRRAERVPAQSAEPDGRPRTGYGMIYDEVMKKKRVADVELHLKSGTVLQGIFFVYIKERPLEVLNDERRFIPFRTEDGQLHLINKDIIAMVKPFGEARIEYAEEDQLPGSSSSAALTELEDFDIDL